MSQPRIADVKPVVGVLKAGEYYWCTCGHSANQPWCDGSHSGSSFTPMQVVISEEKRYAMCTCKHTKNPPFCDGSHKQCPAPSA